MTDANSQLPARIMALDLGTRRTGIALGGLASGLATPHSTVMLPFGRLIAHLRALAAAEGVSLIVIGNPTLPSGDESKIGAYARRVGRALESAGLQTVLWDEGLTSWAAEQILRPRPADRARVDRLAAALLLQDYLDHHRQGGSRDAGR
jgi:putative holliday junction resolvase